MPFSQYLKVGKLYRPNGVADITYLWYNVTREGCFYLWHTICFSLLSYKLLFLSVCFTLKAIIFI